MSDRSQLTVSKPSPLNARQEAFACAQEFRADLPPGARLVYDGGAATDVHGHPVAHNASTWFAWLDRHGATYAAGAASLEVLDAYARRGGWFWIAKERELADPAFRAAVDARHRLVASCGGAYRLLRWQSRRRAGLSMRNHSCGARDRRR